jgi:hypothetical protein
MNSLKAVIFITLFLAGCAVSDYDSAGSNTGWPLLPVQAPLSAAAQVQPGMSRTEVGALMGNETLLGYRQDDASGPTAQAIKMANPYRAESVNADGKDYFVEFYLTQVKNADHIIAEDELTPFVFAGDVLAGKGWDFYFKLKQ